MIEKLNQGLEQDPIAYGSWQAGQDPSTAIITTSNLDVSEPATRQVTAALIYLLSVFKQ